MAYANVNKAGFEIKSCGRCGGSGSYSYCQTHGSTCFGCGGTGWVLTKRGAAARAHYLSLLVKPVESLQVGDSVFAPVRMLGPDVWCRIDAIHMPDGQRFGTCNGVPYGSVEYSRKGVSASYGFLSTSTFRSVRNEEERKAHLTAALAYQDTLGENGKPLKRAKKSVNV